MKLFNKGIFLYAKDQRLPIIKKLLSSFIGKKDLETTYAILYADNLLVAIVKDTAVYSCYINEFAPEEPLYIDCINTEFAEKAADPETDTCALITDIMLKNKLDICRKTYIDNLNSYALVSAEMDMQNDKEFSEYLKIKADQGARFYRSTIENKEYCFPVFTGFPKIASGDKINIFVYDKDATCHIINQVIYKKKINRNLSVAFRVLKLF